MLKKRIITFLYTFILLAYSETVVRHFTIGSFDTRFAYTVAFCIPLAALLFIFTLFKNHWAFKTVYNLAITFITVLYCVQVVYYEIFGGYCSVAMMLSGGGAVTNFAAQTVNAIKDSALCLILLALPVISTALLTAFKVLTFEKAGVKYIAISAGAVLVLHGLCIAFLTASTTAAYTPFDTYCSTSFAIDTSVQNLGCFTSIRRDAENILLRKLGLVKDSLDFYIPEQGGGNELDENSEYGYNISDIDLEEFGAICDEISTAVSQVTDSVIWRGATKKNEYTGMFKGKNLIMLCAEAYSPYLVSEELTPTLYKLSNEGFIFENYYGSFESITTNGEYTYLLGMFPDLARARSFEASQKNTFPFTLGNMFTSIGVDTYGFHNYSGTYYKRNVTHPNIGYERFITPDNGLNIKVDWPSSDLDMMVDSVDDYINSGKQFHTYYMTFSGHYQYNWDNPMSKKNRDAVEHLDYSEPVKAYLACNLELEYALAHLMESLEAAGIADDTVIVLTNDHYPYGLTVDEYSELAGKEIDNEFEKYHNHFICWSGDMEEPVYVDKLCSTMDILPTLLNLFGFEFDSRFIVGRDVLSDYPGIAILANKSFITDDYKFDAVNNKVTYLTDREISEQEVKDKQSFVNGTIGLSKVILNTDYYSYYVDYINGDLTLDNVGEVEGTLIDERVEEPEE